jgi:hypothetical protein
VSVGATNRLIEAGFVLLPPVYNALVTTMMRGFGLSRRQIGPSAGNVFESTERHEGGPARWSRAQVGLAAAATAGALAAGIRLLR